MHKELFFLLVTGIIFWSADSNSFFKKRPANSIVYENQTQNDQPQVRITLPKEGTQFLWNSSIRYSIAVSDKEDGESEYAEIPANEIFLEATYLPNQDVAEKYLEKFKKADKDPPGLSLIKSSICFSCHADKSQLVGPSWADMAARYSTEPTTIKTLADHVIFGSSGIWGDGQTAQMPPNPTLSPKQARLAVAYLLEQGGNKNSSIYPGAKGAFRTIQKTAGSQIGVYVLTATYTDQGVNGDPQSRKRGQHSILLFPND